YTCRFAKNLGMTDGLVEVTNVPQGTGGFTTCKAPDGTLTDNTVYYVQFVAYDGTGPELYSESGVYSFFYNTVDEGPTVPALKTPQDGAKVPTTTPTLTIGNSSDPDSQTRTYQIQIATDKDFNSIVVDKAGIAEDPSGETKLVVASGVLNEDTTYYWRARALDTDDSLYSEWSAGISFTINTNNTIPAAPALDVPQDGVEVGTNTPNLTVVNSFDPEGDPLTYTFVIDTVNTLNSGNKQEKTVSENAGGKTFWTPSALEENTVYYWQVCVDDGSKSPNCTPIYSFKVNAQNEKPTIPQVKSPTNLSTVTNLRPDLVVSNSSDADGDTVQYHFQLSTSSDFSTTIIDNMSVPQGSGADTTLKLLADLSEDTRYFWRVEALDEHGLSSGWTSTQQFFVSVNNDLPAIPKLLSPQNEITINTPTPTLTAENVTDPEGNALVYEFEIDTDPGFSGVEYQRKEVPKSGGAQTTFTPATLKENLTYYWRVRVSDGSGTTGWSEVWSFTVDVDNQPPTNPVATSPDNGQVLTVFEVALNIENSSDPEGDAFDYIVQFYRDEALSQKLGGDLYVKPQAGTKTIFTYGTNGELQKLGAGDFYWRVQAVDKKGGKSGWSNIAHFVINDGSNPGDDVTNPTDDVTNPTNDTSTPTDDSVTPTDDGVTPDSGDPNNPDSTTGVDAGSTSKGGGGCTLSRSATTSPSTMLVLAFLLLGLALRRRYQG
ncbi:MAG: hypothetical protein KC609_24350, partial [Myxococcales bacterium]|nr:hypothetical protein [Myxococcales bacterium]